MSFRLACLPSSGKQCLTPKSKQVSPYGLKQVCICIWFFFLTHVFLYHSGNFLKLISDSAPRIALLLKLFFSICLFLCFGFIHFIFFVLKSCYVAEVRFEFLRSYFYQLGWLNVSFAKVNKSSHHQSWVCFNVIKQYGEKYSLHWLFNIASNINTL